MNLSEPAMALLIDCIVRDVAELADRTSPPDDPDAMLVTHSELRDILWRRLLEKPAPYIDAVVDEEHGVK